MPQIKLKRLSPLATVPTHGSDRSACYDLYAATDKGITIEPHTTVMIPTGWSMEPDNGYFVAIVARSGIATKRALRPANCIGICDEDYRGEYMVALHNDSDKPHTIEPGERIAQMMVLPYELTTFTEVDELSDTARGEGGFGSTGRT